MTRKGSDKKITYLEPSFNDILVCKKAEMRPFLETFVHYGENVAQEGLGTILGIFELTDNSEDSSYIANYLISVIKKEYFSKTKRGPIESFEATLRKANLALANLAEHKTLGWIGNLNAICAVIEKGNIHLAQTGTAKAYLLRGKTLTDISEKEEPLSHPSPLKTFEDVLSGRLQENDKIIITTDSIFNIFSFEEIKRSAIKFSREEFIRFLKTALINELEKAAVLVADINKKEEEIIIAPVAKESQINAWSQEAFARKEAKSPIRKTEETQKTEENIANVIQEELDKKNNNYTDKKTGHIYIKEDEFLKKEDKTSEHWDVFKEKMVDFGAFISAFFKTASRSVLDAVKSASASLILAVGNAAARIKEKKRERAQRLQQQKEKLLNTQPDVEIREKKYSFKKSWENVSFYLKNWRPRFKFNFKKERRQEIATEQGEDKIASWMKVPSSITSKNVYEQTASKRSFLPNLSKIKEIITGFNYQQRLYALLALGVIIVVPYFILKIERETPAEIQPPTAETPLPSLPLEADKNVVRVENLKQIYSGNDITRVININGRILVVKKDEIIDTRENKNFSVPAEFLEPDMVAVMDDLNLIFFLKSGRALSFSPLSGKFQSNNLNIPENSSVPSAQAFLTYLYLLDTKNGQIYRYPRAEGGFGEKTNWVREEIDLTLASDMAINENIFVLEGKNILKLFRGRKQDFSVEQTATAIVAQKIYTLEDSPYLYILDKNNSRIIKLDGNGAILNQFYNFEIGNALDFAIDEESNTIYFSISDSVKSFEMGQ